MHYLMIAIPFVWSGMIGAISFIEAPLKFRAPNVTREIGLGIGKIVFQALNRIELVLAAIIIACLIFAGPQAANVYYILGVVVLFLLTQTVWLLPRLNARVVAIIAGQNIPSSNLHLVFVALEIGKMISLVYLGIALLGDFGL